MKAALWTQSKHRGGYGSLGGKLGGRTLEESRRDAGSSEAFEETQGGKIKFCDALENRNSLKAYKRGFAETTLCTRKTLACASSGNMGADYRNAAWRNWKRRG